MTFEQVALAMVTVLGAAVSLLGGVVWHDIQRRVTDLETGAKPLAKAVAELTVEVRHLNEELARYRDRD